MDKYVAVDLDGVIAQYDGWKGEEHVGEPKRLSRNCLEILRSIGFRIIVYTCRDNLQVVEDYMEKNLLPYDYINENPEQPPSAGSDKIFAHYYIDDRNVFFKDFHSDVMAISNDDPPIPLDCKNCIEYDICKDVVDPDEELNPHGCSGYLEIEVESDVF